MLINTGLVEIGAHGYHHVNFTQVAGDKSLAGITPCQRSAGRHLSTVEVPYLAYPWGNTTEAVTQLVKEAGYQMAFTTRKKKLTSKNIDLLRIPRVSWSRRATLFKLSKYYLIPWVRSAG